MTKVPHSEFENKLGELAVSLLGLDSTIDTQLMRNDSNRRALYCLTARFDGGASLERFLVETIPSLRRQYPEAWGAFRRPYEIVLNRERVDESSGRQQLADSAVQGE